MKNVLPLNKVPLNQTALVVSLNEQCEIRDRMLALGITPGSEITPVFRSPFADPTAFLIKNTLIALRKKDSAAIIVSVKGDACDEAEY